MENDYKIWDFKDIMTLRNLRDEGKSFKDIAVILKRSEEGCRVKYYKMFKN